MLQCVTLLLKGKLYLSLFSLSFLWLFRIKQFYPVHTNRYTLQQLCVPVIFSIHLKMETASINKFQFFSWKTAYRLHFETTNYPQRTHVFFKEEKDEAGKRERKGDNGSCSGVPAGLSLCHRSTTPVARRDVHLRTLLTIRCPAVATDIKNTNKGY